MWRLSAVQPVIPIEVYTAPNTATMHMMIGVGASLEQWTPCGVGVERYGKFLAEHVEEIFCF